MGNNNNNIMCYKFNNSEMSRSRVFLVYYVMFLMSTVNGSHKHLLLFQNIP